ncbi:MAG: hypothetical protein EBV03_14045, partial [Proteobacteria bacterium]|nr:hypothetical protein [Pseudomonadota bacterium]
MTSQILISTRAGETRLARMDGECARDEAGEQTNKSLGFGALSAQDWQLIEAVSAQTRQVGQMMQREGTLLVTQGTAQESSGLLLDAGSYRKLCDSFRIPSCAPRLPTGKNTRGKKTVRDQMESRALERHAEQIAKLNARFPRAEMGLKHWEGYVVAFRVWARTRLKAEASAEADAADACDKIVSCGNLVKLLQQYPEVAEDLNGDIDAISARFTFQQLLAVVAARESLLVSPQ